MADSTSAPKKIPTPPRPSAVAGKPASVPPAPASRPSPPKVPTVAKAMEPQVEAPKVEANVEAPKVEANVEVPKVATPSPTPIPAPPAFVLAALPVAEELLVAPPVVAVATATPAIENAPEGLLVPVVAAAPPPVPSSSSAVAPRRSLLSIVTWDAFRPAPDPLALAKMTPAVTMRRDRFTKYVKGVVGGCAGLCLLALVRVAVASASEPEEMRSTAVHKVREAKTVVESSEERLARAVSVAVKTTSSRHR
jgi:hypothetical protein